MPQEPYLDLARIANTLFFLGGGLLRYTHQEIAVLREELAILKRLARAQDRKFEGSEGYAMARRLWAAEEELRVLRSKASSLAAEVGFALVRIVILYSIDSQLSRPPPPEKTCFCAHHIGIILGLLVSGHNFPTTTNRNLKKNDISVEL